VIEREPVRASYLGREVLTNPPPSTGGILIALALDLLGRSGVGDLGDANTLALVLEVMEECNLARGPRFGKGLERDGFAVEFLSESRLEQAAARVERRLGGERGGSGTGGDALGSTTHISALDADGNAASLTCSNGSCSGVMPPGSAIHLNNMLGEEDLNPLGFHQHSSGSRVTSMMAPTIVLRDGEVELALGSAGSNRLRSAITQVIAFVVGHGMEVGEAVRHGRLHYEAGVAHAEPGFEPAALDELERCGYELLRWKRANLFFGGAQAVHRASGGSISGAGDPRRGGEAVVVE
jgi:gamma-glutamyltranspeptidase/glutathione hydrolase